MNSERTIFLNALSQASPAQQAAYLEEACGSDRALRQRIEALLQSHDRARSFLDKPAIEQVAPPSPLSPRGRGVRGQSERGQRCSDKVRDSQVVTKRLPRARDLQEKARNKTTRLLGGIGRWSIAAAVVLLVAAGVGITETTGVTNLRGAAIRLFTPDGTLVVDIDDPGVSVSIDDGEMVIKGAGPKEIRVKVGKHQLHASKNGQPVMTRLVEVQKAGRTIIRVGRENGPPRKSFEGDLALTLRAGRGQLSPQEMKDLTHIEHRVVRFLADAAMKKLLQLFANLPDETHDTLQSKHWLKWSMTELTAPWRDAFNGIARGPGGAAWKDVGFAILEVKPPHPPRPHDGPPPEHKDHKRPPRIVVWYALPAGDADIRWGLLVAPPEMDEHIACDEIVAQLESLRTKSNTSLPERPQKD